MNYDILFDNKNSEEINQTISDYFLDQEVEPIIYLPNFNAINIIVGSNNSGKSRFMRYLMSYKNLIGISNYQQTSNKVDDYNKVIDSINAEVEKKVNELFRRIERGQTIFPSQSTADGKKMERLRTNKLSKINDLAKDDVLSLIEKNVAKLEILKTYGINSSFFKDYLKIEKTYLKKYDKIKRYFIPILRTAHSLYQKEYKDSIEYPGLEDNFKIRKIEDDIFLETLNKYHNLENSGVTIFTGIHLYKEILNTRNSIRENRKAFEKFEDFIGENFFEGKKVDIVALFDKKNSHDEVISFHIEGENHTRNFYELGDGIQALIILMYKIFMAENDSFIFIDEPELNLHPGMQRLFLEQITSNKDLISKNLTYIITTHSNHFLDLTIEKENVSIYSFSKEVNEKGDNRFIIKNVNAGDNQILKNLGVNNSSVFMANCSIWVEGISDRNYIKAFLYAYCKYKEEKEEEKEKEKEGKTVYPKEDIDFTFFEYAGGNIEHYIFDEELGKEDEDKILKDINSMALSNRIYLLADSDMAEEDSAKDLRLKKLELLITDKNINGKIFRTIRESENLLSKQVWKKILIEFCNKKLVEGKEDEIQKKINEKIDKLELEQEKYIGSFLKKIKTSVDELNEVCKKNKQGTWQTFRDKAELSRVILKKTVDGEITWEDFKEIPEVDELTKSIYRFIKG